MIKHATTIKKREEFIVAQEDFDGVDSNEDEYTNVMNMMDDARCPYCDWWLLLLHLKGAHETYHGSCSITSPYATWTATRVEYQKRSASEAYATDSASSYRKTVIPFSRRSDRSVVGTDGRYIRDENLADKFELSRSSMSYEKAFVQKIALPLAQSQPCAWGIHWI